MKIRSLISLCLCVVLWQCIKSGNDRADDATSSETEMFGVLVKEDSSVAVGAIVSLRRLWTPNSDSIGGKALLKVGVDTTDEKGEFRFQKLSSGDYQLEGVLKEPTSSDTLVIALEASLDTLESLFLGKHVMLKAGKISGKVLLGNRVKEGVTVFIPGTGYSGFTDLDGNFTIDNLPPGTYSIIISEDEHITEHIYSIKVYQDSTVSLPQINLKVDPVGRPPSPFGLKVEYDSVFGIVKFKWNAVDVSDLKGYIIYRSEAEKDDFKPLNSGDLAVPDTFYNDTLPSGEIDSIRYEYKVKAYDSTSNESDVFLEKVSVLTFPSKVPHLLSPPNESKDLKRRLEFKWSAVDLPGVKYELEIIIDSNSSLRYQNIADTSIIVNDLMENKSFSWKVIAITSTLNIPSHQYKFHVGKNNPPKKPVVIYPLDNAEIDSGEIKLTWSGGDADSTDSVNYFIRYSLDSSVWYGLSPNADTFAIMDSINKGDTVYWHIFSEDGLDTVRSSTNRFFIRDSIPQPDPSVVAHWDFEAGIGDTLRDIAGTTHGVIQGATWENLDGDGGLRFDGVDDHVALGQCILESDSCWEGSNYTLEVVFSLDTQFTGPNNEQGQFIYSLYKNPNINFVHSAQVVQGYTFIINDTSGQQETLLALYYPSANDVGKKIYVTIVVDYDNSTIDLYWNGEFIRQGKGMGRKLTFSLTELKSYIGACTNILDGKYPPGCFYDGVIYDIRVSDGKRTAKEISDRYETLK